MQFGLKQLLVRQLRLVLSNERRRQSAAERELHHLIILARTEEHSDVRDSFSRRGPGLLDRSPVFLGTLARTGQP